jgi:hypothetical protein
MGTPEQIRMKRTLYTSFIHRRQDISESLQLTIEADMPRTYPKIPWAQREDTLAVVKHLLVSYASVQQGDGYLQGFNYIMMNLYRVFQPTEECQADTWWCFSRIISLVRPLLPDFNVNWFHWCRRHWFGDFHLKLRQKCPTLETIISDHHETFSTLITVKWFLIWFCQTVSFAEILKLWDFLISVPPHKLMRVYTLITYEIVVEAAPTITYNWSRDPTEAVHSILSMRVSGVTNIISRVSRCI